MAKKEKAAKKEAAPKKEKSAKPRGPVGKTSGLGTSRYWLKLFGAQHRDKLTDDRLAKEMNKEFPSGENPYVLSDVRMIRNLYNRGKVRFQTKPPEHAVHEYDKSGNPLPLWGEKGATRRAATKKEQPDDVKFGKSKVVKAKRASA